MSISAERGSRRRKHCVSLIDSFFFLTGFIAGGAKDDAFGHELDDGHELKEYLQNTDSKLGYFYEFTRIFDF